MKDFWIVIIFVIVMCLFSYLLYTFCPSTKEFGNGLTAKQQQDFDKFLQTNPLSGKEYHITLDGKKFVYYKSKGYMLYQERSHKTN